MTTFLSLWEQKDNFLIVHKRLKMIDNFNEESDDKVSASNFCSYFGGKVNEDNDQIVVTWVGSFHTKQL